MSIHFADSSPYPCFSWSYLKQSTTPSFSGRQSSKSLSASLFVSAKVPGASWIPLGSAVNYRSINQLILLVKLEEPPRSTQDICVVF